MKKFLFILLTLCATGVAHAQEVKTLKLTWTLPTTDIGTPPGSLVGESALTGVQVFISTSPIPTTSTMAPTLSLGASATTAQHSMTVPAGGKLYARVKACNLNGCSAFSSEVSRSFAVPGVPTNLLIEVVVTPAP